MTGRVLRVVVEFVAAYVVVLCASRMHHAASRSRVVWHDLARSSLQNPFAAQPSCAVPTALHSLARMRAVAGFEPEPAPERWCLPQLKAAQDREARHLDALRDFMRAEAGTRYLGLHARHVGAALQAVYWRGDLLLNPATRDEEDASTCTVRPVLAPETTRTIAYYRRLTVLYETPAGHLRNLTLRGDEACVMTALL